jgi:uncharacterized protein YbcI
VKLVKDLERMVSKEMGVFYEKEMGLRPSSVKTVIQGDLIIIRFENALSPSEMQLIQQEAGKRLIHEVFEKVSEQIFPRLQSLLQRLTEKKAVGFKIELQERGREKVFFINLVTPIEEAPPQE